MWHDDAARVALAVPPRSPPLRGRGRHVSTVLGDALAGRPEARGTAAAAAFAEAVGWPLAREASLRKLGRDGLAVAVARTEAWAEHLRAAAPLVIARMNERLGPGAVRDLDVRVGPLD